MGSIPGTPARVLAAVMAATVITGGWQHFDLYRDGYNDIPVGHIGAQFMLNAVGAAVIAIGLVVFVVFATRPAWLGAATVAAGVAWGATSLLAFAIARTDRGWFGFRDQPGLNPSPQAAIAVYSEAVAIGLGLVILAITLLGTLRTGASSRTAADR